MTILARIATLARIANLLPFPLQNLADTPAASIFQSVKIYLLSHFGGERYVEALDAIMGNIYNKQWIDVEYQLQQNNKQHSESSHLSQAHMRIAVPVSKC